MTIDEAIEINKTLTRVFRARLNVYERDAVKLGIEALKFIADYRERAGPRTILPLKGETEE